MPDVFLSYAREDLDRARRLATAIEGLGWSVWWDRKIPAGRTFADVIDEALKQARCVIVLWSRESVKSEWVREEADDAKGRRKLVPVRLDNVIPPLGFRAIHAADLVGWDGSVETPGFRQLIEDLRSLLGDSPAVPATPLPSTRLDERRKNEPSGASREESDHRLFGAEPSPPRDSIAPSPRDHSNGRPIGKRAKDEQKRAEQERRPAEEQQRRLAEAEAARLAAADAERKRKEQEAAQTAMNTRPSAQPRKSVQFSGSLSRSLSEFARVNGLRQTDLTPPTTSAICKTWCESSGLPTKEGYALRAACGRLAGYANENGWNLAVSPSAQEWMRFCTSASAIARDATVRQEFMPICLRSR
jgi:hypothetical protein